MYAFFWQVPVDQLPHSCDYWRPKGFPSASHTLPALLASLSATPWKFTVSSVAPPPRTSDILASTDCLGQILDKSIASLSFRLFVVLMSAYRLPNLALLGMCQSHQNMLLLLSIHGVNQWLLLQHGRELSKLEKAMAPKGDNAEWTRIRVSCISFSPITCWYLFGQRTSSFGTIANDSGVHAIPQMRRNSLFEQYCNVTLKYSMWDTFFFHIEPKKLPHDNHIQTSNMAWQTGAWCGCMNVWFYIYEYLLDL